MSAFKEAVERGLKGLEHVSAGACPGCHECGLDDEDCPSCDGTGEMGDNDRTPCKDCDGRGSIPVDREDHDRLELAGEPHFSWHACDCCGSHLGGDRHPAHGIAKTNDKETIIHLDVCTDCLCYIANGDEPEEWRP